MEMVASRLGDTADRSYSSLGSRAGLNLTPGTPLPPPPTLPSPPDTQAKALGKSLPQQRICRAEGNWVSSQAIEKWSPFILIIPLSFYWSDSGQHFSGRTGGILFSSSASACLMRWWLDGVRTRPDQDINQSFLVGNPSSPHGNTIFSSINKVWSLVLIRITAVSPPYKSYLVSAAQTNETNRIIKMQIKPGKPRFWLSIWLEEIRPSLCWLVVNYPSLVCGVTRLSPSLITIILMREQ